MSPCARFGLWLACVIGAAATLICMVCHSPAQAKAIARALSRAGNAALGGDERETISSHADRARANGKRAGCVLCRVLDWLDPHHCRDSAGK
jgi:hypothetical protein